MQALVEHAAAANGMSKSRRVAEIVRKHAAHEWPQDCLASAGQFADSPLRVDGHDTLPPNAPRLAY